MSLDTLISDELSRIQRVLESEHESFRALLTRKLAELIPGDGVSLERQHLEDKPIGIAEEVKPPGWRHEQDAEGAEKRPGWQHDQVPEPAQPLPPSETSLAILPSSPESPPQLRSTVIPAPPEGEIPKKRVRRGVSISHFSDGGHGEDEDEARDAFDPRSSWNVGPSNTSQRMDFDVRYQFCEGEEKKSMAKFRQSRTADMMDVYRNQEQDMGDNDDDPETWFPLHPDSKAATLWDILCMAMMIYDFITVPLQFFDEDVSTSERLDDDIGRWFWTLNLVIRFCIGSVNKNGKVSLRMKDIAQNYLKTWFPFDIIMVLVDWTAIAFSSDELSSTVRAFQILRLARLLRLVRLVEIAKLAGSFFALHLRSDMMSTVFGVVKILLMLWSISHLCACGWYRVGTLDDGRQWTEALHIVDESLWFKYITSLHWSLAQISGSSIIEPQSEVERTYAAVTQFAAFLLSVYMVSDLTTLMTQMQLASAHHKKQVVALQRFLSDHKVPTRLAARITENAETAVKKMAQTPPEDTVDLLKYISNALLVELHFAMNSPYLAEHPFFYAYRAVNPSASRTICHTAVTSETYSKRDVVFSVGEVSTNPRVLILCKGALSYLTANSTPRRLEKGVVVSEHHLWTEGWAQLGALSAMEATHMVSVNAAQCVEAMIKFRTKNFYPAVWARQFISELNLADSTQVTDVASDFIDLTRTAQFVFGQRYVHRASGDFNARPLGNTVRESIMRPFGGGEVRASMIRPVGGA